MKSRNREINIFNMSLLDILCGALGAFCFMMIVLLPYYKPDNPEDQKKQKEMDETMKKLEELKKQMPDSKLAKDMEDLIKKLQEQIKELEGRVNKLNQENKELTEKNKALDQKNKEQAAEIAQLKDKNNKLQDRNNHLEMRMPGAVAAYCSEPVPGGRTSDLDICLWAPIKSVAGQSQPPFDPSLGHNPKFFSGDRSVSLGGPVPMTVYMWRDLVTGIKKKLYFKLHPVEYHGENGTLFPLPKPMKINGQIMSGTPDANIVLPEIELTPEHPWMLVGFLEANEKDATLMFTPATAEEREAEWRALDKSPPPPPPPPPSPKPKP